jgi:hypothetical protein
MICLSCRARARIALDRTDGQVLHFDWTRPRSMSCGPENRVPRRRFATREADPIRPRELAHIIKAGVVDGWKNLGDTVKHWLAESERAMRDLRARNGKQDDPSLHDRISSVLMVIFVVIFREPPMCCWLLPRTWVTHRCGSASHTIRPRGGCAAPIDALPCTDRQQDIRPRRAAVADSPLAARGV